MAAREAVASDHGVSLVFHAQKGPDDGADDTYVGVVNQANSGVAVLALQVSSAGIAIFGFDGDGIAGGGIFVTAGDGSDGGTSIVMGPLRR